MFEVGTSLGSLLVLTSPQLSETSRHVVCDSFALNVLLSSPDKKWILAASKDNSDLSPKVKTFKLLALETPFLHATVTKHLITVRNLY